MAQLPANYAGTVSHGTMLSEDLAGAFIDVLRFADPEHALVAEYDRVYDAIATLRACSIEPDADSVMEWQDELVQSLFDALDSVAPDGTTFSAHPGDGSDYGFWPAEDSN